MEFPTASDNLKKELTQLHDFRRIRESFDLFCKKCKPDKKSRILEIGAGEGVMIATLKMNGFNALGIEPELESVEKSNRLFSENNLGRDLIYNGFAEKLPFEDNYFDYVISYQVLEHVNSLDKTFQEIERVLNVGGMTFNICPNYNSFYEGHYRLFMLPFMSKDSFKKYLRFLNVFSLNGKDIESINNSVDSLNFIKPNDIQHINKKLSKLQIKEEDGGLLRLEGNKLVIWSRGMTDGIRKKTFSRSAFYFVIDLLNFLGIGKYVYLLISKNKWYPQLIIIGKKNK